MSTSFWLTRTRRGCGNFLKTIICNNQTLCPYQTTATSSLPSFFLCNSSVKRCKDCGTNGKGIFGFRYLFSRHSSSASFFGDRRHNSSEATERILSEDDDESAFQENQDMDFPGGKISFTAKKSFLPCSSEERVPCYRVLDEDGYSSSNILEHVMSKEVALKMYSGMVTLQTMDKFFVEAQRQGRMSFYIPAFGEEAIGLASAAAFSIDDVVLAQYREPGILLWRGYTVQDFANQCFGNNAGHGKGRQTPIHHGSKNLNLMTISSPLATQLPQAVGVAYSLKMDKKDSCVVAYLGDGSSSEGDFHAGLNFAAVLDVPVVFICRNNGWAISTPVTDQFRSDGVVVKGQAYGISSIRVDGNDALAMYDVVRSAREIAINERRPILIEAMTYRVSHHSTSDDSTRYRSTDEIEYWKTIQSPVTRFRKWVERKGWWSNKEESELHLVVKKQVKHVLNEAEKQEKPPLRDMFTDVYEDLPSNLTEQETSLRETIRRHPQDFPKDIPL